MWRWFIATAALIAVAGTAIFLSRQDAAREPQPYRLATVTRGDISVAVLATAVVNPVTTVRVGSQVSGQIAMLSADFNTRVKKGDVIAKIDPASFEARVRAAAAELAVARANVSVQKATIEELRAEMEGAAAALLDTEQELRRVTALFDKRIVAHTSLDRAVAVRDQARARRDAVAARTTKQKAQLETALAQVKVREASLRDRELDLERTTIRSPVDGVVIDRNVDPGQTVAASLQAPVLFTIAQNLDRMQVEISVDEADIGRAREGARVEFTVDAYPQRRYAGMVTQVRKAPNVVANVVTYTVVAAAANPDRSLLPGMTANVGIIVGERKGVLRVADAAIRFRPQGVEEPAAEAPRTRGPEAARAMVERLSEALALDDATRTAVAAIFRETGMAIRELRQGDLDGESLREGVRALQAQAARRVENLLDDDQREGYRAMRATSRDARRVRVWVRGPDGAPAAVPLVVGLSDGTSSEIVRGELEEGAEVIVGRP